MDSQKDSKGCIIGSYYLEFTNLFIYHNLLNPTSKVFKAFMSKFGKISFKLFSFLLYLVHWPLWGWVMNGTKFCKTISNHITRALMYACDSHYVMSCLFRYITHALETNVFIVAFVCACIHQGFLPCSGLCWKIWIDGSSRKRSFHSLWWPKYFCKHVKGLTSEFGYDYT